MEKMKAKKKVKARKLVVILILSSFFLPVFFLSLAAAQTVEKRIEIR